MILDCWGQRQEFADRQPAQIWHGRLLERLVQIQLSHAGPSLPRLVWSPTRVIGQATIRTDYVSDEAASVSCQIDYAAAQIQQRIEVANQAVSRVLSNKAVPHRASQTLIRRNRRVVNSAGNRRSLVRNRIRSNRRLPDHPGRAPNEPGE